MNLISLNEEQVQKVFRLADHSNYGLLDKFGLTYWGFNSENKTSTFVISNAKTFLLSMIKYGI